MMQKICFAGFGGQGVLSMGKLIAYAAMLEEKEVSWCPSYGPEMRGGTANCTVVVSDDPVASPLISHDAGIAVVMNEPSLRKFQSAILPGGTLLVNSDLVKAPVERTDIKVIRVPANTIAANLKNPKLANMVMIGALQKLESFPSMHNIFMAFPKVFGEDKSRLLPINERAMLEGAKYAEMSMN
jgi:2-oxoglutarate ferredoxin oxidoreductase subunit gamma